MFKCYDLILLATAGSMWKLFGTDLWLIQIIFTQVWFMIQLARACLRLRAIRWIDYPCFRLMHQQMYAIQLLWKRSMFRYPGIFSTNNVRILARLKIMCKTAQTIVVLNPEQSLSDYGSPLPTSARRVMKNYSCSNYTCSGPPTIAWQFTTKQLANPQTAVNISVSGLHINRDHSLGETHILIRYFSLVQNILDVKANCWEQVS